jgi:hypothetical protein
MMEWDRYEKIITLTMDEYEVVEKGVRMLLHFMYKETGGKGGDYFRLTLGNSERGMNCKDLKLEWVSEKRGSV